MKCVICGQKKGKRFCLAEDDYICSLCCETSRQMEISCPEKCEHLEKREEYQVRREINKKVNSSFHDETDDIFQVDEVIEFATPLEMFFIEKFYDDENVNDNDIYEALSKLYLFQTGKSDLKKAENKECEELIFEKFYELDKEFPKLSKDLKTRSVLRILKSIKEISGGIFGNRNYLELIYSQFNKDGKWRSMLEKMMSEYKG
jgi:hypothetical protein